MSKRLLLLITAALLCAFAAFVYTEGVRLRPSSLSITPSQANSSQKVVVIGDRTIRVDVAATEEAREQGLSGRSGLARDQGMLFVFDADGTYPFWMKDMRFAIDIIWLSSDKRVVDIAENVPPESYPSTFSPKNASRFVLELPAGFASENKIQVGEMANF